jgi:hypothetical protein
MKERKISELRAYDKNPRKMTKGDFETLKSSLDEHGDLSGVVFNRKTGNLVGGHQRTNAFKNKDSKVVITEEVERTKTGTVAVGYIESNGERFSYREVEWDEDQEAKANILANKVSGQWDFDMLANAFDVDTLMSSGWSNSELGFATTKEQDGEDTDTLDHSMNTYLEGNIKQVVLYFSAEEFEETLPRLDKVMEKEDVKSHTEAVIKLLDKYEGD